MKQLCVCVCMCVGVRHKRWHLLAATCFFRCASEGNRCRHLLYLSLLASITTQLILPEERVCYSLADPNALPIHDERK